MILELVDKFKKELGSVEIEDKSRVPVNSQQKIQYNKVMIKIREIDELEKALEIMDFQKLKNDNLIFKIYAYDTSEEEEKFISLINFVCLFAFDEKQEESSE